MSILILGSICSPLSLSASVCCQCSSFGLQSEEPLYVSIPLSPPSSLFPPPLPPSPASLLNHVSPPPQISVCNLCSSSFLSTHVAYVHLPAFIATDLSRLTELPPSFHSLLHPHMQQVPSTAPRSPACFVSVLVCTSNNITLWTAFSLVLHRNSSSLSFLFLVFPPPSLPLVWNSPLPVVQQLRRIYTRDFHTFTINNSWIYCTLIPAAFVILI